MFDDNIIYNNYLQSKLIDEKIGCESILSPGSGRNIGTTFEFEFKILTDEENLIAQGELFASRAYKGGHQNKYGVKKSSIEDEIRSLRNAYIFSYLKVLWISHQYNQGGDLKTEFTTYMFGGHKMLCQILTRRSIVSTDEVHNSVLATTCRITEAEIEALNNLKDGSIVGDIWKRGCKDPGSRFYIDEFEKTLLSIKNTNSQVDVRECNGFEFTEPEHFPLGNTCYDKTGSSYSYLADTKLSLDTRSFYWGFACFISLETLSEEPCCEGIYKSIGKRSVGAGFVSAQVYSVTNIAGPTQMLSGYTDSGRNPNNNKARRNGNPGGGRGNSNNNNNGPSGSDGSGGGDSYDYDDDDDGNGVDQRSRSKKTFGINGSFRIPGGNQENEGLIPKTINIANVMSQNQDTRVSDKSKISRWLESTREHAAKLLTGDNLDRILGIASVVQAGKTSQLTLEDLKELAEASVQPIPITEINRRDGMNFGPFSFEMSKREVKETSK
jgi:hypothetical protein